MELDTQVFPVSGRVVGIVFFLPANLAFTGVASRGAPLKVADVRRTVTPAGRHYLVLAGDPHGAVVDGNDLTIFVQDSDGVAANRVAISSKLAWAWTPAVKFGLNGLLQRWETTSRRHNLDALRRFLSTVSLQRAFPALTVRMAGGVGFVLEGCSPTGSGNASAIVVEGDRLLQRQCALRVLPDEGVTVLFAAGASDRIFIDVDGALVEIDLSAHSRPESGAIAQAMLDLAADVTGEDRALPDTIRLPARIGTHGGSIMAVRYAGSLVLAAVGMPRNVITTLRIGLFGTAMVDLSKADHALILDGEGPDDTHCLAFFDHAPQGEIACIRNRNDQQGGWVRILPADEAARPMSALLQRAAAQAPEIDNVRLRSLAEALAGAGTIESFSRAA